MIAPLLIMAQSADVTPDIVVMHDRLRRLRVNANIDRRGRVRRCEITVSSGDAAIDRQACLSTRDCAVSGHRGGESLANCVDTALIAFARSGTAERTAKEE